MRLLFTVVLLICFSGTCITACNGNKGKSSGNPAYADPNVELRYAGIVYHALTLYGEDLVSPRFYKLPKTGDSYSAVFDFSITEEGTLWYPLSTFQFGGPKLVEIDLKQPDKALSVIEFDDYAPEPYNEIIPVPQNVLVDGDQLFVLRKYCLTNSMLTVIDLSGETEPRDIILPADGGGLGSIMAIAGIDGEKRLGIRLFQSFVELDPVSLEVIKFIEDDRLNGTLKFSKHSNSFVMIAEKAIPVAQPGDAGEWEHMVGVNGRNGEYSYWHHWYVLVEPSGQGATFIDFPQPGGDSALGLEPIVQGGQFELSDDGTKLILMGIGGNALEVIDIPSNSREATVKIPGDNFINGEIANIGNDVFCIGGGLIFDLKTLEMQFVEGDGFFENTQIKPIK